MRIMWVLAVLLCCSCKAANGALNLVVRKQGAYLLADIRASERSCIVTYKIFYRRFGLLRVYGKRLGIDIKGECELEVPAGTSMTKFNIEDSSWSNGPPHSQLCVDVTYFVYEQRGRTSLRHESACE
jgi:hypothetical protein